MTHVLESALIGVAVTLGSTAPFAHATLETQQAPINANYKAVMRTPHGCEGTVTLKVRIQIPEGVIAVKPQPKPGWTLDIVKAKYAKTYDYYGTQMTECVIEITWTGKLLDENYDEFVFRAYLTDSLKPGEMLYFPTIQECEKGAHRWIEIPAEGKKADEYKEPAPGLKLLPQMTN
jgi:uncharacterized protein YcnI